MSLWIRTDAADARDYAAIRADGYQAEITKEQIDGAARLFETAGQTAYNWADEEFYDSYVPEASLAGLDEAHRAQLNDLFPQGTEARRILEKAAEHKVQLTFTRDCGDSVRRIRLVSAPDGAIDMNMSSGSFRQVTDAFGISGWNDASDLPTGEADIALIEAALETSAAALMFSSQWFRHVAARLKELCAYGRANGATRLIWS